MAGPRTTPPATGGDRLDLLVGRVAAQDRAAFRCLYTLLALRVWHDAVRALADPSDAPAVTRSTFVEVWHLARHHVDESCVDVRGWIAAITARQAHDRRGSPDTLCWLRTDYDDHVYRELAGLLDVGPAAIRLASDHR